MSDSPGLDNQTEIVREDARAAPSEAQRREAGIEGAQQGTRLGLLTGALICTVAIWLFVLWRVPSPGEVVVGCKREHAGFIDIRPWCSEPVSIDRQSDLILAHPGAALEDRGSELRVRLGKASFVAGPRSDGSKLRVRVSHGIIEVSGGRFVVTQDEQEGRVKVDEGTIVFHWDEGGEDATLEAGSELVWPRGSGSDVVALQAVPPEPPSDVVADALEPLAAAPSAPEPIAAALATPKPAAAAATPKPPAAPKAAAKPPKEKAPAPPPVVAAAEEPEEEEPEPTGPMSMEDILKKISSLRSQHRTREAVELLLAQSKRGDITDAQMARLSWEIGMFLQDSGDKVATCSHWKSHARKYPDDAAHADRVQELIQACDTPL